MGGCWPVSILLVIRTPHGCVRCTTQQTTTWHDPVWPHTIYDHSKELHEKSTKWANTSGLSSHGPAVITESGGSSNWCQMLFTCYFQIKWHFQGQSLRVNTHQCDIWGNWKQGHWVCSISPFVLFISVAAAQQRGTTFFHHCHTEWLHPVHSLRLSD